MSFLLFMWLEKKSKKELRPGYNTQITHQEVYFGVEEGKTTYMSTKTKPYKKTSEQINSFSPSDTVLPWFGCWEHVCPSGAHTLKHGPQCDHTGRG